MRMLARGAKGVPNWVARIATRGDTPFAVRSPTSETPNPLPFVNLTEILLDSPIAGIALATGDLRCTECNQRLAQIIARSPEDLIGQPLTAIVSARDRRGFEASLRSVVAGDLRAYHAAHSIDRPSGMPIFFEIHASLVDAPNGGAPMLLAQVEDVTVARTSSERLRLTERALHAAGSGITIVDARLDDLPIVYVNPEFERITGYSPDEVLGKNCRFLNRCEQDQPGLETVRQAIRDGEELTVTLRNFRKDGSLFWNELTLSPVFNVQGELTHFVGIQDDVTHRMEEVAERERQLAEVMDDRRDAEDAASAREMMLAVVSHELRSPLNAIRLWNSLLQSAGGPDPETLKRAISQIQTSVDAQSRLIADLLDATRFEAGSIQVDKRRFDWAVAVRELAETEAPVAAERGIELVPAITDRPAWVHGDRLRLEQVLRNLLTNAFKFTPGGGSVEVGLSIRDERAVLQVSDTGPGVDPAQLKRLFDRFWQADKRDERRHGGVGLGLYLVKQIVVQHGGSVSAQSDGAGMRFVVELPIHTGGRQARPRSAAAVTEEAIGSDLLVVDDDVTTAEALGLALRLRGHRVRVTNGVDAALGQINAGRPRVLISDLSMPGSTGFDLVRTIRESELDQGLPRLSALAISGRGGAHDRRAVMAAGFDGYLEKPIDVARLQQALGTILTGGAEQSYRVLLVGGDRQWREELRDEIVDSGQEVLVASTSAEALLLTEHVPAVLAVVGEMEDGSPAGLARKMRADSVSLVALLVDPSGSPAEADLFDLVLPTRDALLRQLAIMRPQVRA